MIELVSQRVMRPRAARPCAAEAAAQPPALPRRKQRRPHWERCNITHTALRLLT